MNWWRRRVLLTSAIVLVCICLSGCAATDEAALTPVAEVTQQAAATALPTTTREPTATVTLTATAEPIDTPGPTTTSVPTPPPPDTPGPVSFQAGDIITIGDHAVLVLGYTTPSGDQFSTPDEGTRFVVVDVVFVNGGDESVSLSSLLQMTLKDDTGQIYDVDFGATLAAGASMPEGELVPGERIRGCLGYQVPEDATGLVFVFDADIWGGGRTFVKLGPEPGVIEPPDQLPGERPIPMHALGETVQAGDLALTVNEVTWPSGDDFNKPEAGHRFLVVDMTLENTGSDPLSISSMLQMSLKDSTGQIYNTDLSATMAAKGKTPDGKIAPQEKLRGQVGYQVPTDRHGFVFVFDADILSAGKVFFALPE